MIYALTLPLSLSLFLPPSLSPSLSLSLSLSSSPSLSLSLSPPTPPPCFTHREGDMYAALRDTESALALSPSYQKALRRRLQCLQHLNWNKAAKHLLQRYSEEFPSDSSFIDPTKDDLEIALKTESGMHIIIMIMCVLMVYVCKILHVHVL